MSCTCVCDGCNCQPPFAEADCRWDNIGTDCIFTCECFAC
jgi:hypothetical protein